MILRLACVMQRNNKTVNWCPIKTTISEKQRRNPKRYLWLKHLVVVSVPSTKFPNPWNFCLLSTQAVAPGGTRQLWFRIRGLEHSDSAPCRRRETGECTQHPWLCATSQKPCLTGTPLGWSIQHCASKSSCKSKRRDSYAQHPLGPVLLQLFIWLLTSIFILG